MNSDALPEESPADRRRQRVRTAILDAAERVFSTEGETGLSIRRLAEEIDYSPAAIYKYFGSKEELLDELKESFFERLMSTIDKAALTSLPFEARVRHCFAKYVETAIARPHHYAAAFSSTTQAPAEADDGAYWCEFEQSHKGQAFMVVVGLVREGQEIGVFDTSFDPFIAAKSLWASMHGIALLLIHLPGFPVSLPTPQGGTDTAGFIQFHAALLFRSLCAAPVSPACSGHGQ
ncbi:transcriptional regulator, TetR family [Hyphomonas neptunium ATCC 15444]|uniref:Transcriptional regulator, TetR family n=2 Tax=Hyphomonas TaxID=85 RepID=Q0C139_HYPNA|nr:MULTISPECIES: TetR/AcrR family transcriptional regulator [Hyphomonas]ABI75717.1 transcriptional regulator, TetR family [Hyphomonas neptunium ATCC 15444]KCZ95031.1 TetR family transcriptional regulator [Hyphomonas hirschiana VP5]